MTSRQTAMSFLKPMMLSVLMLVLAGSALAESVEWLNVPSEMMPWIGVAGLDEKELLEVWPYLPEEHKGFFLAQLTVKRTALAIGPIVVEPTTTDTHPNDVQILAGNSSSCDDAGFGFQDECVARVAASDNNEAYVFGDSQAGEQGGDLIRFLFNYPIPASKPKLTEISFEIETDECVEVRVSLGGGSAADGVFYSLDTVEFCDDEKKISMDVPELVARALGFWSSRPEGDLISKVDIELFSGGGGPKCSSCLGGTSAGVDESTASSGIADP